MPRLLLVDDNPSIHKIAESLLSGSDVQLVCAESGVQALGLVAQGERFDAALIDIFMSGMDGWALLDALRMHPATAMMPVAMMAGVLDTVEPQRLSAARVQGYVKKPVELRDLAERVRTIIATGVATSENEPTVAMSISPFATAPALQARDFQAQPEPVVAPDDLLQLTAEDLLYQEDLSPEPAVEAPEITPEADAPVEDLTPTASAVEVPETASFELESPADLDLAEELPPLPATAPETDLTVLPDMAFEADDAPIELDGDLTWGADGLLEEEPAAELTLDDDGAAVLPGTQDSMTSAGTVAEAQDDSAEIEALSDLGEALLESAAPISQPEIESPVTETLGEASELEAVGLERLEDLLPEPHEISPATPQGVLEVLDVAVPVPTEDLEDVVFDVADLPAAPPLDEIADVAVHVAQSEALDLLPPLESEPSVELPDLGPSAELFTPHDILDAAATPIQPVALPQEWDDSEDLLSAIQAALPTALMPGPGEDMPDQPPTSELVSPHLEQGVGAAMAAGAAAAAAVEPDSKPTVLSADALVEALLADPVALERLGKALARHLSGSTLREVAWEVMPDLADRLRTP